MHKYIWVPNSKIYHLNIQNKTSLCKTIMPSLSCQTSDSIPIIEHNVMDVQSRERRLCKLCKEKSIENNNYVNENFDNLIKDIITTEIINESTPVNFINLKTKIRNLEQQTERLKKELEDADFTVCPGDRVRINDTVYMYVVSAPDLHNRICRGVLVNGKGFALSESVELKPNNTACKISTLVFGNLNPTYNVELLSRSTPI